MASQTSRRRSIGPACVAALLLGVAVAFAMQPVPTTVNDYFVRGSQPMSLSEGLQPATSECAICHGGFNETSEPFTRWSASLMAQAVRDPVFKASLAIANQDSAFAGDQCLRCHAPMGWMSGRAGPPSGAALGGVFDPAAQTWQYPGDFEGVSCMVCHRMVDPRNEPGAPARDATILAGLIDHPPGNGVPVNPGSGGYVLDPIDHRRGPLDLAEYWGAFFPFHSWDQSPFHESPRLCATCHEISNPLYTRGPDGSYTLGTAADPSSPSLGTAHATQDQRDMFPIARTYSEWSASLFAAGPVDMGDYPPGSGVARFGGEEGPGVSECQSCHMPATHGTIVGQFLEPPQRTGIPQHNFNGSNTWVLRAVAALYRPTETNLTPQSVDDSVARAQGMLERASDMQLTVLGASLNVRIVNMTGHKLPTGIAEGRRMWINVRFLNAAGVLIGQRGGYDTASGAFNGADTKVYEARHGLDPAVAALAGLPAGPSFHSALTNTIEFDNRIPPMGFSNSTFAAVQAQPVGYAYADGQYWDDTLFPIPPLAASAEVTVFHQTTTRDYIEFLRDANNSDNAGQTAYAIWDQLGRSPPDAMDWATLPLSRCAADWDGNGQVQPADIAAFVNDWFNDLTAGTHNLADVDGNGQIQPADVAQMVSVWFNALSGGPCR